FECYTASGLHALRALEYVARQYHKIVTGRTSPPPDTFINWQVLINELAAQLAIEKKTNRDTRLLELVLPHLQPIKDIFRNPIFHPILTLDKGQALQVFQTTEILISSMVRDGERRAPRQMSVPS